MRLDKFLADSGIATRSQVKMILKQKRVRKNQDIVTNGKIQIDEKVDEVFLDDERVDYEKYLYYVMNKPKGVISATEDTRHATVLNLLGELAIKRGVFPVGRLDIDTHGFLLLTNNGALSHAMLSPKKHVEKIYIAKIEGIMTDEDQVSFEKGITLDDGYKCMPASLEIRSVDENRQTSIVQIKIKEGKFHQVKRMVKACGKVVVDLQRISMGPLQLDETLKLGEFRNLHDSELESLKIFNVEL